MNKTFIAVTTHTLDNKLVLIQTSNGDAISNENGLDFDSIIDFLFGLRKDSNHKSGVVFVTYAFSRDNEFIFSALSKNDKDKLFQSWNVKRDLAKLDYEEENIYSTYYQTEANTQTFEQLDFEKYVNKLSKQELLSIKYKQYSIQLANGKRLVIRKNKKSITFYDIYSFFKKPCSLRSACKSWLQIDNDLLERTNIDLIPETDNLERLKIHSAIETNAIKCLAEKLDNELRKHSINLSSYHGATAVTAWLFNHTKAKQYFHCYRYKHQLSGELWKAVYQSYYAGRVEQFKLGTLENVNIYDINSAYAFAGSFLPVMLRKPVFQCSFEGVRNPFSLWFCEYDFTGYSDLYFGIFPNREMNQTVRYKSKGKSYFWLPEILFALRHYPDAIKIHHGFSFPYTPAPFTEGIIELYELRKKLQAENNPLEKVIKLALSAIYGKFCQHNGRGRFYNMFYAGFITSFVRTQLLDATLGKEKEIICFQTDAIHTTAKLDLPISNELGEYKHKHFDKITYLDSGIWQGVQSREVVETKTKGYKSFDFNKALEQLTDKRTYQALVEFFIGHNVFSLNQFIHSEYLHNFKVDKSNNPVSTSARLFDRKAVDLSVSFLDSKMFNLFNGSESAVYLAQDYKETDFCKDTMEAMRI